MNKSFNGIKERRKYISAFNDTMIKIWKEQITLLGVIDTGMLLGSTHAISMKMDSNATEAERHTYLVALVGNILQQTIAQEFEHKGQAHRNM